MSKQSYNAELLKIEGVRIEGLEKTEDEIVLQISLERQMQVCKLGVTCALLTAPMRRLWLCCTCAAT